MQLIAILLSFGALVSAIEQTKYQLPAEKVQNIKKNGDKCAAELNVDPGIFAGVVDGTVQPDDVIKKYFHCLADKLKLVDEVGHALVDKMANVLGDNPFLEQFKAALRKCNEVTKENPVETLFSAYRCYFETSPVVFAF